MSGRHHAETPPGDSTATSFSTLAIIGIAVLAIIAGVATIAAWAAPRAEEDGDLSTIVVQPSASLPYPTAAPEPLLLDEPPSEAPPSAPPTASVSLSVPAAPTESAALLVGSAPAPVPSTTAPAAPAVTSSATTTVSPSATAARSLPEDLTASYTVTSTSDDGFVADVTVRNPTGTAQAWTVVLTYSSGTKMTVTGYWNAVPTASGRRLTFAGDPLPAGASYSFGFQVATDKGNDIDLIGCTINGIACTGF